MGLQAAIASSWFTNTDGLLILPRDKEMKTYNLYRLLFTDSRHYLLPLDEANHALIKDSQEVNTFLTAVQGQARGQWPDTRYSVWHLDESGPGRKRSETSTKASPKKVHIGAGDYSRDANQDTVQKTKEAMSIDESPEREDYWEVDFPDDGRVFLTRVHILTRNRFFRPTDVELPPGISLHYVRSERHTELRPTALATARSRQQGQAAHHDACCLPQRLLQGHRCGHQALRQQDQLQQPNYNIYYKCDKCRLGREAPPGTEHSLVPRECRHASSLPTPATASSIKVTRDHITARSDRAVQERSHATPRAPRHQASDQL